jgi:DNA polymerase III subunit epsilon
MYAIIDIETTGGSPVTEKITEIAIILHDGQKIVDEYTTLINPEKKIPYFISTLTGITNAMVAESPKFYEVARKIVELTENCIFVAHNVSFDYQFIRNEFKRLGYEYKREKLCTVQLSRKMIPGLPSYSLGKLCDHLHIDIHKRHRASGDATATTKVFEILLNIFQGNQQSVNSFSGFNKKDLHPALDPDFIDRLPEQTGIYYFFNDKNDLIYIGKSKNIRDRVLSHFRNFSSRKSIEMRNAIASINYELTGSELIALLKESHEIKQQRPLYNRAQRRALSHYGLYHFIDEGGYIRFSIEKNSSMNNVPLCSFPVQKSAKIYLHSLVDEYQLCQKLCGLYSSSGSCFSYEIGACRGACIGKEHPESYNLRATSLIKSFQFKHSNFFILDKGRTEEEIGVVQMECGKYLGYGFIDSSFCQGSLTGLESCIQRYDDNRDIQQIIRYFLQVNRGVKQIPYDASYSENVIHNNKFIKQEEFPD